MQTAREASRFGRFGHQPLVGADKGSIALDELRQGILIRPGGAREIVECRFDFVHGVRVEAVSSEHGGLFGFVVGPRAMSHWLHRGTRPAGSVLC